MTHVFISHSSSDRDIAKRVCAAIERRGIACWISSRDVGPGENYQEAIVRAIRTSYALVLVFSNNANASNEIKKEIAIAGQNHLGVIPIRVENVAPSDAFAYELATRQWIDLFENWDASINRVIATLESLAPGDSKSAPPPADSSKPASAPRAVPWRFPTRVASGMAGAAIVAVMVLAWPKAEAPRTARQDNVPGFAISAPLSGASLGQEPAPRPVAGPGPVASPDVALPAPRPAPALEPQAPQPPTEPAPLPAAQPAANAAPQASPQQPDQPAPPAAVLALAPPPSAIEASPPPQPRVPAPVPKAIAATAPPSPAMVGEGGQVFRECKACPEMVVVPPGSARIGSPAQEAARQPTELTPRNVTFTAPFAVGRYHVTFDEWDACVAEGGCNGWRPGDFGWGRGRRPVIFVSWNDVQSYIAWLSRTTGGPYRLLSETEWEYAARGCRDGACAAFPFWFGDAIKPELANYNSRFSYAGSPKAQARRRTVPVDDAPANPFGLFHIVGNVRQWTQDCWNPVPPAPLPDGAARLTGDCKSRVVRGGGWNDEPKDLRSAARSWELVDERSPFIGFRVARTISP